MIDGASPAGIKAAYEALQGLIKIRDWTQNADAKLAVASALNGLADAKIEISQLKIENENLKAEIEKIKRSSEEIENLKRINELFIDEKTGLYKCPTCIEVRRVCVSLPVMNKNITSLECQNCKARFRNPDYVSQPLQRRADTSRFGGF